MGEEFQDVLFYNKSFLSDISCDISKMSCLGAEIVFYVFSFLNYFVSRLTERLQVRN